MKELKLSIIVPAYNAEKYLEKCFNSLLDQEYNNFEIIVVDDGSKDKTGKICDEYAEKDSRIKVIHQENRGRSGARNSAIKIAEGEYIGFLDADDFYAVGALSNIAKCIQQNNCPDVFFGRFESFSEDTDFKATDCKFDEKMINGKTQTDVIGYLLSIPFMYTQCRYYVRKELLLNEKLVFIPGLAHEDEAWTPVLLSLAKSFCALTTPFYIYRVHSNSFMTTADVKKLLDKVWIAGRFCDLQEEYDSDDIIFRLFESRIQKLAYSAVSESYVYPWRDLKQFCKKCDELSRKHPSAFTLLGRTEKLAKIIGWKNVIRINAYRVKKHQRKR